MSYNRLMSRLFCWVAKPSAAEAIRQGGKSVGGQVENNAESEMAEQTWAWLRFPNPAQLNIR